ncbi:MAG TPA: amidohydrolase family protein [Methanobacteriaceae archaeon]|nr:amidohydrolase family protein [Methanobacteriaceae archaeon]
MITIQNGTILYGDDLNPLKANLSIEDNKIIEISKTASGGRLIDAKGCIVAPSLINSHIHLGDSVAKDLGDGESLEKIVKPPDGIKHRILKETPREDMVNSIKDSLNYMVQTGTSTFIDFREGGIDGVEILRDALDKIPIRSVILGRQNSFFKSKTSHSELVRDIHEILDISDGIGLSGFGEVTDKFAGIIARTCVSNGKIPAIHVAENEKVQKESLALTGKTEVERALDVGFNLLVHLTSATAQDIKMVSEKGVSVVGCPRANGALSTGIPPLKDMLDLGINLLLGTDNVMINSPNMFQEMEYALKVTRGLYQEYFSPKDVLKMATVNAGKALNLNLGSLKEDNLADIMIVEQVSLDPILSLLNRTQSKNIIGLIINGRILY